jgi:hypothetical protein
VFLADLRFSCHATKDITRYVKEKKREKNSEKGDEIADCGQCEVKSDTLTSIASGQSSKQHLHATVNRSAGTVHEQVLHARQQQQRRRSDGMKR